MEREPAHHGQPQLRRHGRLVADLYRPVRGADEPDPQGRLLRQGPVILRNGNTPPGLDEARARAGTTQSAELQPGGESWAEAYVASGDLAEEIAKLKAQEGKPIIAHGGVSFARSLVAQGLIDQFALIVPPVALGKGLPLFSELVAPMPLKLVSSKAFPGGAVAQIYRPANTDRW
jgi:riboflavin biosynthesis pyrimidine reductase